jgi:hypothetical protein
MNIANGSWIVVGSVVIFLSLCIGWAVNEPFLVEMFKAYNSRHIPPDTQKSGLLTDLETFKALIHERNDNVSIPSEFSLDYDVLYTYKDALKKTVEDTLDSILSSSSYFKGVSMKVSGDIRTVYKAFYGDTDVFFRYSLDIYSKTRLFATQIEVVVLAKNMQRYLSPNGKYQTMILFPPGYFKVVSMQIIEGPQYKHKLDVIPYIDDYFVTIDNNLYVMTPSLK